MEQTVTIGEQEVCPESESLKFSATPTPQVENPSGFDSDSTALVNTACFIHSSLIINIMVGLLFLKVFTGDEGMFTCTFGQWKSKNKKFLESSTWP